ncbi:fructose-bisphosphatase class II [Escherichia coli]|nr:fructose-bisphosphatase class II [Escherichia coli]
MKTKVAAIYGKRDVRLREFELPEITDNELLVSVISDSVCLSTWKAALLGSEHKRVPDDLENHPVITGHECAGVIVEVGKNLTGKYKKGQRFVLQPAMGLPSGYSAGYSYEYFGGNATYMIIPEIAINLGCVLPYHGSYFAAASLAEPMCCIIGAYHANYHTTQYVYEHRMGVKPGGNIALLACAGPMGIGAIDYAINGGIQPSRVVVVDIDDKRLAQVQKLLPVDLAASKGIELVYVNTKGMSDPVQTLRALTGDVGFDDIFVYAAVGVKVFALPDGDVAASVLTCWQDNPYDVMYTIGGAPEGVISACAVKALGGDMQAELIDFCQAKGDYTENRQIAEQERKRCREMGVDVNRVYSLDELVRGNDILFSATGVTGGELVNGIQQTANGVRTQTLLIGGADQTCNIIDSLH